jgi:hypothetical protein
MMLVALIISLVVGKTLSLLVGRSLSPVICQLLSLVLGLTDDFAMLSRIDAGKH